MLESSGDAESLTLRAVAREAAIAAPSIYRHFSDKDELVNAVVADRFGRLDDVLRAAFARPPVPALIDAVLVGQVWSLYPCLSTDAR